MLGSMTTVDDHVVSGSYSCCVYRVGCCTALVLTGEARPLKLRESPKATPTTLVSKGAMGIEGNDLKMVTAVLDDRKKNGQSAAKPLYDRSVLRCYWLWVNLGEQGVHDFLSACLSVVALSRSYWCSLIRCQWGRFID